MQAVGICVLLGQSTQAALSLSPPADVRVVRVMTGPSSKMTRTIFDEGAVILAWTPVPQATGYVVRHSTTPDFENEVRVTLPRPTCTDATGWHDSDGPFFDCHWYAQGTRCIALGTGRENFGLVANDACCACGGGNLVPTNTSHPHAPLARHTLHGLVAGREIYVSVASLADESWSSVSAWGAALTAMPVDVVQGPVTGIGWGEYNSTHAHVVWSDNAAGPAATEYQVFVAGQCKRFFLLLSQDVYAQKVPCLYAPTTTELAGHINSMSDTGFMATVGRWALNWTRLQNHRGWAARLDFAGDDRTTIHD